MTIETTRGGLLTLAGLREEARRTLVESGVGDSPALDADVLLGYVTGFARAQLLAYDSAILDVQRGEQFRMLVARRAQGEPVAYLTGRREFCGLTFGVGPGVLVPRPETELLVEIATREIRDEYPERFLDLGTGSGCIAIALAHQFLDATVWATDMSPAARKYATRNANQLGVGHRVRVVEHDWRDPLPDLVETPVDVVACNPPYLTEAEFAAAPGDVREFEPEEALRGGDDGVAAYPRVIALAWAALRPGGLLALEIGAKQRTAVCDLLDSTEWTAPRVGRDLAGLDRVIYAQRR